MRNLYYKIVPPWEEKTKRMRSNFDVIGYIDCGRFIDCCTGGIDFREVIKNGAKFLSEETKHLESDITKNIGEA